MVSIFEQGDIVCLDFDPQAGMLDLNSRGASFEEKAPSDVVAEAVDMIIGLVEIKLVEIK